MSNLTKLLSVFNLHHAGMRQGQVIELSVGIYTVFPRLVHALDWKSYHVLSQVK